MKKIWAKLDSSTRVFVALIALYILMYIVADIAEIIAWGIIGV